MMGRGVGRFHDSGAGMDFDNFNKRRFQDSMDGEPFAKNPRFDPYSARSFGRNEPFKSGPMDPYRDPFMKEPPIPEAIKPNDCEIIVMSKEQQSYAEALEQRLRNIGISVDLLFMREEGAVLRTIEDIGRRGTYFAVVITQQNELHGSLTLNILQDSPQEHRNMPLDDALKLIARSFLDFVQKKKAASGPPMDREIRLVLSLLLDEKYVTANELERLITYLKERREGMLGSAATLQNRPPTAIPTDEPIAKTGASDQEDLQQRILNILGSNDGAPGNSEPNMVPAVTKPPVNQGMPGFNDLPLSMIGSNQKKPQDQQPHPSQHSSSSSNTYINFDNKNVQLALDSLIQSGPNLLKNIGTANSPTGNPRGPGPQQSPQGMMGGPGPKQSPQGMMGGPGPQLNPQLMMGGPGGPNQSYGGGPAGMQPGYRNPLSNSAAGGRFAGPNIQGSGGFGMGRQMRY